MGGNNTVGCRKSSRARLADRARVLALCFGLAGAIALIQCSFGHYCLCGHLVHRYRPGQVAVDVVWLSSFGFAVALAPFSNLKGRKAFYGLAVASVGTSQVLGGCLGLPCALGFALFCAIALLQERTLPEGREFRREPLWTGGSPGPL